MPTFTITEACEVIAETLQGHGDFSPTTIRCSLNDLLDSMEKSGYKVNHGYNQAKAIKRVRSLLGETERHAIRNERKQ